jgi:hypothetical protein
MWAMADGPIWDQQKRSTTTEMDDSEALDPAFLIIADPHHQPANQ